MSIPELSLIFAVVMLGVVKQIDGKVLESKLNVHNFRRNQGWNYLGRMVLSPGKVQLTLTVQLQVSPQQSASDYRLDLAMVSSDFWKQQLEKKCNFSKYSPQQIHKKFKAEKVMHIHLTKDSGYRLISSQLLQIPQKTSINFVLRDCQQTLMKSGFTRRSSIDIQLSILNNDNHISQHEYCYNWMLPILILAQYLIIFMMNRQKSEDGDVLIKILLKISIWIGLSAICCKFIGYILYAWINGKIYDLFDVLYLLLHATSQWIILFLLTMLAYGWTIQFSSNKDSDFYVPIGFLFGFVNIILNVLNKISDGNHDKYHMFDTISAYFMIFFRIVVFIVFLFGCIQSIAKKKEDQKKLRRFYQHLVMLGTIYMMFLPVGFMLIQFIQAQQRQEIMVMGLQFGKLGLNVWLAVVTGWKKSSYRELVEGSFMQKDEKYY